MHPRQPRLPFANAWFFPVAALYAAFILPISVFALLGLIPAPPGLSTPAGTPTKCSSASPWRWSPVTCSVRNHCA